MSLLRNFLEFYLMPCPTHTSKCLNWILFYKLECFSNSFIFILILTDKFYSISLLNYLPYVIVKGINVYIIK